MSGLRAWAAAGATDLAMSRPLTCCLFGMVAALTAGLPAQTAQGQAASELIEKVTAYVRDYEQHFSALVAEERYVQVLEMEPATGAIGGSLSQRNPGGGMPGSSGGSTRRVLKSEYLIARLEDGGWMPFRDVYEVDGRRVADRSDRLAALFLKPGATAFEQAASIMADSTRHNLGSTARSISIPILGLMLLHADVRSRMDIAVGNDELVDDQPTTVLTVRERTRPALVKTIGGDLPMTATLWVEGATGRVVKTRLSVADDLVEATVTTTYRLEPKVGFLVPVRMEDAYSTRKGAEQVTGVATYDKFRRFSVSTDETVKKPPPE